MQRRYSFAHFILAGVIVLGLTPLMVVVDTQAQIAFTSDRDGNDEIYVMDANGKNLRRLTNNRHADGSPSWSPDGKRIVFTSHRDEHAHIKHGWPTSEIYVMDADGGNQQRLTENHVHDLTPVWSPDSERIVFASDRDEPRPYCDIYVMDADGSNIQRLTNHRFDERYPSWSPDGKRIVFSARREGHFENKFAVTFEIYVMDADGGNLQRLTENRKNDYAAVWSPDGKRIAFSSDRKGDFANFEIYVMDADGGNPQNLTNNRAWDWAPSWSPDSKRIAFRSDRDGHVINGKSTHEIYVMDADGGNPQNLTNNRHSDSSPAWLNSPFSVSPAGKAFTMWGRLKQVNR